MQAPPSPPTSASPEGQETTDITGFCYCPPGWDEARLRSGPDAEAIAKIAIDTFTDIAYIKDKNAIQIIGESHDEVYAAQTKLNDIFFPVIVRSKKQWARPDRPGNWGQRRDSVAAPAGSALRKMNSVGSFNNNNQQHQPQQQYEQPWLNQQQLNHPQQHQQQHQQMNYYQQEPQNNYQRPNRPMSHRSSVADLKRNSYGNHQYGNGSQEQPISPASPFARW
ncbi:hypothetical protein BDR26DRAFT_1004951 [Obelidium mucronatum]|nr:hypothetical protein BDR26DRAFT_1004951 [Obelidium mucronatum]